MMDMTANGTNSAWGGVDGSREGAVREIESTVGAATQFPQLRMGS
jgi:hypothetical protein